ncbi:L-type lectin-domain containing protein [Actinoplanes sp. NPDC024001]|uniref:L-type lectin-domain containing protein n=1 Tax=Actinoplanes sp. NPDC024001 TaxID=3154598 RepID=UPI0033F7C5A0
MLVSRTSVHLRAGLVAALAATLASPAAALGAPVTDGPGAYALNGTARVTGADPSVIQLTGGGFKQAGSVWAGGTVDPAGTFEVEFTAHLRGAERGADGIALVVQGQGPRALGGWGGGLGYRGVRQSVAVEFDTHRNASDPDGNHLAVTLGGNPDRQQAVTDPGIALSGQPFRVRVRYEAGRELRVYLGADLSAPAQRLVLSQPVDLAGAVGGPVAWVGFTGSTGLVTSEQHVYDWTIGVTG